jgi:hypothetical protein
MGHCSSNLVDLRRAAIPSPSLESSIGGPKTALDMDMGQKDLILGLLGSLSSLGNHKGPFDGSAGFALI